jgi:hypothetical protein
MTVFDRGTRRLLGDLKMQVAAGITNRGRNDLFWRQAGGGYRGPRILAEGDSWFCYPAELVISGPTDIVAHLGREFAVATQATPGDIVAAMRDSLTTPGGLLRALQDYEADILLLSGGGNDLLGDGQLEALLAPGRRQLPDYFKTEAFEDQFWSVIDDLDFILRQALDAFPDLKAVIHGYDYAIPSGQGPWLLGPLQRLGVPPDLHQAVIDRIVDWFNRAQIAMVDAINREYDEVRVVHADLRNSTLTGQWYDEIHPTSVGFAQIAARIRNAILAATPLVA